ncbi:MAG: peptide chain release factor N(5)-glutamine methyltransferase [Planctomycetaceae bacterium]
MSSTASNSNPGTDDWTIQRILEWTTGFLKQKGIESPRVEAELLLAHARKCPRIRLYTDFNSVLTDSERAAMRELVQRRAKREPIAYIIGSREFYGRPFDVAPAVLIPRPETETLVDVCLELLPPTEPVRIIEVGAGSGCISISLALQRPNSTLHASDISEQALEIARRNAQKHSVADRIQLVVGSALLPFLEQSLSCDAIVSNPPYIRDDEKETLAPEIRDHEPPQALFAGSDGLDVVRLILAHAGKLLKPGGFIALELDPAQCPATCQLLLDAGFTNTRIHPDLAGLSRVVSTKLPVAS